MRVQGRTEGWAIDAVACMADTAEPAEADGLATAAGDDNLATHPRPLAATQSVPASTALASEHPGIDTSTAQPALSLPSGVPQSLQADGMKQTESTAECDKQPGDRVDADAPLLDTVADTPPAEAGYPAHSTELASSDVALTPGCPSMMISLLMMVKYYVAVAIRCRVQDVQLDEEIWLPVAHTLQLDINEPTNSEFDSIWHSVMTAVIATIRGSGIPCSLQHIGKVLHSLRPLIMDRRGRALIRDTAQLIKQGEIPLSVQRVVPQNGQGVACNIEK